MSEVVVSILQKAVIAKGTLPSWEVNQVLGRDLPAMVQVTVCEWAERLTEGEGKGCVPGWGGLDVDIWFCL